MGHDRHSAATARPFDFLHQLDGVRGDAVLVQTDTGRLRSATFLDGRERFWTSERVVDLELQAPRNNRTDRLIFHVGFCGSTLLARLLDDAGQTLVLKEPQCLADIAGQRRAISSGDAIAPLDRLVDYALGCMALAGQSDEQVVIKPTNWVNSIIPVLCAPGARARAVFLSMDRRAFLGAVFRGGRARLEFCMRLAGEIAPVVQGGEQRLHEAIAIDDDPFNRSARIVSLLHALQERLFDEAIAANEWPDAARIDFAELAGDPHGVAATARSILGLTPPTHNEEAAEILERDAKNPARAFDRARREREDEEVERHHGARFDAALDWLGTFSDATSR